MKVFHFKMVVLTVLGIIVATAVPILSGFRSMAEGRVCDASRKTVERMYSAYLNEKNIDHEDSLYEQFIMEKFDIVCPADGVIRYENGLTKCSVHEESNENEQDEGPREEIPWL